MTESVNLPKGGHPVCPRCGTAVGQGPWCEGCGLNSRTQETLPTGDAYAAGIREQRWLEEQKRQKDDRRRAEANEKAAERDRRAEVARRAAEEQGGQASGAPRRKRWALLAAALLVLLVGAAAAFYVTGGFDRAEPAAQTGGSVTEAQTDESSGAMASGLNEPDGEVFFTDLTGDALDEPRALLIFQQIPVSDLEWRAWGSPTTKGTGVSKASDCEPNCAEGSVVRSEFEITLSDIQECGGRRQYTKAAYVISLDEGDESGEFDNPACDSTKSGNDSGYEPLDAGSPVTTEGLGPVLAGMSLDEAQELAGTTLVPQGPPPNPDWDCQYFKPENLAGVSFMVVDGEIARVDVSKPTVATLSGIRVGDSEDDVLAEYGEQIESSEAETKPEYNELVFTPTSESDNTRMIFVTDGSSVTAIQAGRQPEVKTPEGCV